MMQKDPTAARAEDVSDGVQNGLADSIDYRDER